MRLGLALRFGAMTAPARSEGTGGGGLMRRVRGRLVAALAAVRVAASAPSLLGPPEEAPNGRLGKLAIRRFARSGLRLPSEASPAGPGARNGAADPEMPVGRSRLWIVALVGIPVLINAVMLLSELKSGAPNLNDDAFHYLLVQRAGDAVANGQNPLDFWMPQLELGFPQFLYYQNLPHLAVVGLHAILAGTVDLFTTFNLVRYLLLVGFPLTVYWSMRRMGFSMVAAAVGAAASSLLSANFRYGFEYDSYIWRGFGLYTQLWAMHLSFISLACVCRVLQRGTGYLLAILALTALGLSHLIYAYMMVITLGLIFLVFARRGTIRATLTRLLILGGVVTAATAWMWLPFLTSYQYVGASPYLQREKYDSFGAPAILGWLFSGDLLDHGRLPVLTVLLGLGVFAAIVRRTRIGIAALAGFFLWLVLYFGRPTLGPIADLFPLHDGLLFHRFVGEMDLFAIILMGVGGAWLWRTVARLRIPRLRPDLRPAVALAVVLLVLVPAVTERIGFYAQNTIWMDETADAFHSDADLQAILSTLAAQPPGGRTYAGLRTNWGAQMTVGQTKVTDALTLDAIPAVSPPYQSLSLNADMIWSFRDDDPGQFDLLDVRYVIAPAGLAVPSFYAPMQKTTKYALYRVQTSGAGEYVAITARRQAPTQRALFDANLAWFKGPDPDARRFIRWDYETPAGPPTTSAGCPGGGKTDFEYDASDAVHVVVECPASAAFAIKVTYHPNWHVRVDGQPVETFMVSPSFVGINLPAGKHTVDATYEATPTKTPLFLLGLGVLGLAVVLRRRLDWLPQRLGTTPAPGRPYHLPDLPARFQGARDRVVGMTGRIYRLGWLKRPPRSFGRARVDIRTAGPADHPGDEPAEGPVAPSNPRSRAVWAIAGIWLAWAVCLIAFQDFGLGRIVLQRPDFAMNWTPAVTQADSHAGNPYLTEPLLPAHVAWDSSYYLSIAIAGYDDPAGPRTAATVDHPAVPFNYAFMPLYPLAMRVVAWPLGLIGMDAIPAAVAAGVAISLVASLFAMLALYRIAQRTIGASGGMRAVFYLLIFPSGFFMAQVYTEAVFLALSLGAIAFILDRRPMLAGGLAALATFARPTGFLLVIPMGLVVLELAREHGLLKQPRGALRKMGPWLIGSALPVAAYLLWTVTFGHRFTVVEDAFGRHLLDLGQFWDTWPTEIVNLFSFRAQSQVYLAIEFSAAALSIVASVWALRRWPGIGLYGLAVILLPMTSGPPQGIIRFALVVPPIFLFLAWLGRHPIFDRAWVLVSVLLMGLLVTLFSFDFWVA